MSSASIDELLYSAYNNHDCDGVAKLYSENATHEDVAHGRAKHGRQAIADGLAKFFGWFPDARWQPAPSITDNNVTIAIPYVLSATLQTQMGHYRPQGQKISLRGIQVLFLLDGLIIRSDDYWDAATFQKQLNITTAEGRS